MLKLELDSETLKCIVLQNYFYRQLPTPQKYPDYEAYFVLTEDGEPVFIIEESM